jgi:MAternally-affected-uncoordination protein
LQRNPNELLTTMQPCAALIESFSTQNLYQVDCLKIFFLIIQVTHFLQCGQMKSVESTLKNLQHYLNVLAQRLDHQTTEQAIVQTQNPMLNFYWMHMDHLGMLVFLLTIIHSIQTGSFEKAQKLIEKALINLQKLKTKELDKQNRLPRMFSMSTFITNKLHMMIVENQARCSVAMGLRGQSIRQVGDAVRLCEEDPRLTSLHMPQMHCLVGVYSLSVNIRDAAVQQFNMCLKTTNDSDLWLYCAMNLALCYLAGVSSGSGAAASKSNLVSILENIMPDKIRTQNTALTAFSHYFSAIKFYLSGQYQAAQ